MTPTMIIMPMRRKMTFMSMACYGVFKRQDEIIRVERSGRIGDEQDQGGAQQGRQGPVHPFRCNDHIDQQQDNAWRSRKPG